MQAVRDMVVLEEGKGYVLRGKTGWDMQSEPTIGWLVGWAERGERAYVFALNIDVATPEQGAARMEIVKAALREMGGLP
jgi:beta-lactamase class D